MKKLNYNKEINFLKHCEKEMFARGEEYYLGKRVPNPETDPDKTIQKTKNANIYKG